MKLPRTDSETPAIRSKNTDKTGLTPCSENMRSNRCTKDYYLLLLNKQYLHSSLSW